MNQIQTGQCYFNKCILNSLYDIFKETEQHLYKKLSCVRDHLCISLYISPHMCLMRDISNIFLC